MAQLATNVDVPSEDAHTDFALLARVRERDGEALTILYARHSHLVYSIALKVLGETSAAEDLLQELWLQLWRKPIILDPSRGRFAGWLTVVTRNRAIDCIRARLPLECLEDVVLISSDNPAEEAEHRIILERIRFAAATLPAEQSEALELAFFQGLTHSQISNTTGLPLGTVKTRIRAALMRLGGDLGPSSKTCSAAPSTHRPFR